MSLETNPTMETKNKKPPVKEHNQKKSDYLVQGSILAFASILVRLIGLVYRIPMANILGLQGNKIYGVAFNIYNIALILSSYSIPLAVSKMVADRSVKREYKNSYKIFKCAMLFATVSGIIMCLLIFFGADMGEIIYNMPGIAKPLRILAPTIFVVAVLGVFRGFYQGKRTMMPTAFSQVLEQIVNAAVSIFAAYYLMKEHSASDDIESYGAAGGTLGTLFGALTALAFVAFVFVIYRPTIKRQIKRDKTQHTESGRQIYAMLLMTIVPVILSQLVYQISGTVDDGIFGHMAAEAQQGYLGIYSSQYRLLINVPVAISSAMASSLVPSIVASMTRKDEEGVKRKVGTSIKFNMAIAFPAAMGLTVLAHPIIRLLYPNLISYSEIAGDMLVYGSVAVVFYALSTITSAVMQGINKMKLPVIHSAVSLGLHIVLVICLLQFTNLGIYALIIGNVTFPLVVCVLNWISVGRYLKYKQEVVKTFLIPLVCSVIMGGVVYGIYTLVHKFLHSNFLGVLFSIIIGAAVYFIAILLFKCFTEEEFLELPMGRTLLRIAKKCKLA